MKKLMLVVLLFMPLASQANQVEVINAVLKKNSNGSYRVDVTLRHADTGWDHYADGWDVLDENKQLIATRTLYHPHVDEQPFTRSLYEVNIPSGLKFVYIRGHDKVHGYGELKRFNLQ